MELKNLEEVLTEELKDIYSAENQILKALPKMAKKAKSKQLRTAFESHLTQTEGQVNRLDKIAKLLEVKMTGKKCKAMEGLLEEGDEAIELTGADALIDTCLIAAAQRVEHYEISAYGTARAIAERLGHDEVVELLQETLDEETEADEKLSVISEDEILPASMEGSPSRKAGAMSEAEDEDMEEDEDDEELEDGTKDDEGDVDENDDEDVSPVSSRSANAKKGGDTGRRR